MMELKWCRHRPVLLGEKWQKRPVCGPIIRSLAFLGMVLGVGGGVLAGERGGAAPLSSQTESREVPCLLEPHQQATIGSQLDARILEISVDEGDSFQQGVVLVRFDCALQEAKLKKALAEVKTARQRLAIHHKMARLDSISELEVATSQAMFYAAEAELGVAQVFKDRCTITAPYAGLVTKRHAHPHDSVASGAPLMDIQDQSVLKVRAFVPGDWLRWLKPGMPFSVLLADHSQSYGAQVVALGGQIDPASQNLLVRGLIAGEHPLLVPGMSGIARFTQP